MSCTLFREHINASIDFYTHQSGLSTLMKKTRFFKTKSNLNNIYPQMKSYHRYVLDPTKQYNECSADRPIGRSLGSVYMYTSAWITHFAELWKDLSFGKVAAISVVTLWSHDSSLWNGIWSQSTSAVWLLPGKENGLSPFPHTMRNWRHGIHSLH